MGVVIIVAAGMAGMLSILLACLAAYLLVEIVHYLSSLTSKGHLYDRPRTTAQEPAPSAASQRA